jgi:hypothetical protein
MQLATIDDGAMAAIGDTIVDDQLAASIEP